MPPPSDRDIPLTSARASSMTSAVTVPNTLAALATALVIASGALLERPDGSSPGPALVLFAVAVTLALTSRVLGARERA